MRILVVDDEQHIRELMMEFLGREGHEVTLANDPPEVDVLIFKPFRMAEILAAIDKAIEMHQSDVLQ